MARSQRPNAPAIDEPEQGLSREELEAMEIMALPEREALSVAFPLAGALSLGGISKGADAVADSIDDPAIDPTA